MNAFRALLVVGACGALTLTLQGCGDSEPATSPTAPTPSPGPLSAGYSVDFNEYLAAQAGKSYTSFDWEKACSSLKQTPAGYHMSTSGGYAIFSLTCDANPVEVKCKLNGETMESCSSSYKPPPTASDAAPPGEYKTDATTSFCLGRLDRLSETEAQDILDIQNKMRCATGAEPMEWDADLQCQAQKAQDDIQAFEHSRSYDLPISAGENIATGTDVSTAAWMWFLEYLNTDEYVGQGHKTGHFTAMAWRSVKKLGCGIQRSKGGIIRCQYAGDPAPNMQGSYETQIPPFYGKEADLRKCGLPISDVKSQAEMQKGWGILHPTGVMAGNIGLYSVIDKLFLGTSSASILAGCALAVVTLAMLVGVTYRLRRRRVRDSAFISAHESSALDEEALILEEHRDSIDH